MGALTLPPSGRVYVDANPLIYSIERHADFAPMLVPLWRAAALNVIEVVTSELTLLESLVGPLKAGNRDLAHLYELALQSSEIQLIPLNLDVLREAAKIRAMSRLKTPDALHAATAMVAGCVLFVTNDDDFRGRLPMPMIVLRDLPTTPTSTP